MHHFIVLTGLETDFLLYVNVNNIDFVRDQNRGTQVFSSGSDEPIEVKESFDEVCQRINKVGEKNA